MKRLNYIYKSALIGLLGLSATSCEDFLTIYPQDRVVEENFWEDKNDLEGVRYGAYKSLASTVEKLIIWGDLRSDAYGQNPIYSSQQSNYDVFKKIVHAQLDSTMSQYDWGSVYTTINLCNKVLSHGEEVLARDAQFTRTEWEQMKAEMTAMRALNYFYLIRSFKNIPYTTEVINTDADAHAFTTTKQMDVLDELIKDVRLAAGKGRNSYSSIKDTRGTITNTAIYALLAEMYLWRSALREGRGFSEDSVRMDADSVVYFGQLSLDALAVQNQQLNAGSIDRERSLTDDFGSGLRNAMLIKNEGVENSYNAQQSFISIPSYAAIFSGNGNSDESIFELQFNTGEAENKFVHSFWGHTDATHFSSSEAAMKEACNSDANIFDKDLRMWYSCMKKTFDSGNEDLREGYVLKYGDCGFGYSSGKFQATFTSGDVHKNWIFYRMTDVMLMMAEAEAVRGNFAECRNIVNAIHKRSSRDQTTTLASNSDNTKKKCIDIVMKERLLEFVGEGKRWFDLVRYAERIGGGHNADPFEPTIMDGADGVAEMIDNFLSKGAYSKDPGKAVLKSRIKNRYGLYSPIYYMELRANKYLFPQNPVWNRQKGIREDITD